MSTNEITSSGNGATDITSARPQTVKLYHLKEKYHSLQVGKIGLCYWNLFPLLRFRFLIKKNLTVKDFAYNVSN